MPDGWDDRLDEGLIALYSFTYRVPVVATQSERRSCSDNTLVGTASIVTGLHGEGSVIYTPAIKITYNTPKQKRVCSGTQNLVSSAVAYAYTFNTTNCGGWTLASSATRLYLGNNLYTNQILDGIDLDIYYDYGDGLVYLSLIHI